MATSSSTSQCSSSSPVDSGYEDFKVLLECPVCMEMSVPPIYNCTIGHIICKKCQKKVKKCPVCRNNYSGGRNFVAEKLAEKYLAKCRYVEDGCTEKLKLSEMAYHNEFCEYRPILCNLARCNHIAIPFLKYFDHLKVDHRVFCAANNARIWEREMFVYDIRRLTRDGPRVPFSMNCYNHNFLQCMHAKDNLVWIWVAICGIEAEAQGFQAKILISTPNNKMELQWSGPVHALRKSGPEVHDSGLCLLISSQTLQHFMRNDKDRKVWLMTIVISRSDPEDDSADEDYDGDMSEFLEVESDV